MRNPRRLGTLIGALLMLVSGCGSTSADVCNPNISLDITDSIVHLSKYLCDEGVSVSQDISDPQEKNSTIHVEYNIAERGFMLTPQHLVRYGHVFASDAAAYSTDKNGFPRSATYSQGRFVYTTPELLFDAGRMSVAFESVGMANLVPRFATKAKVQFWLEDRVNNQLDVTTTSGDAKTYTVLAHKPTTAEIVLTVGNDVAFAYKWSTEPSPGATGYVVSWEK